MMPPVNVSTSGTEQLLPLRAITLCVFVASFSSPTLLQSAEPGAAPNAPEPQRDARVAFQKGQYDQVIRLLEAAPPDSKQPRELLKVGVLSYVRLGQPESAFTVYTRHPPGKPGRSHVAPRTGPGFHHQPGARSARAFAHRGLHGLGRNRQSRRRPTA